MKVEASIAMIAALASNPSRAVMLGALMDGRAHTARELADAAGVAPSTASSHLARLADAGVIDRVRQGRHHYFRIAADDIAHAIEQLGAAAAPLRKAKLPRPSDPALAHARVCYDHIAGTLGVRIYRACLRDGYIALDEEGIALTEAGRRHFATAGLLADADAAKPMRLCLDWTERTYHLGGGGARAVLEAMIAKSWTRRAKEGRALQITPKGTRELNIYFPVG